jgi:hypothetical protein
MGLIPGTPRTRGCARRYVPLTAAVRADRVAGPTTLSSVRPEDVWKDLTACAVAGDGRGRALFLPVGYRAG